jgi:hypothetical protein
MVQSYGDRVDLDPSEPEPGFLAIAAAKAAAKVSAGGEVIYLAEYEKTCSMPGTCRRKWDCVTTQEAWSGSPRVFPSSCSIVFRGCLVSE